MAKMVIRASSLLIRSQPEARQLRPQQLSLQDVLDGPLNRYTLRVQLLRSSWDFLMQLFVRRGLVLV